MIAALRAWMLRVQETAARWPSCVALSIVWTLVVALLVIRGGPLL